MRALPRAADQSATRPHRGRSPRKRAAHRPPFAWAGPALRRPRRCAVARRCSGTPASRGSPARTPHRRPR
ncbi:hypothetical protein C8241_11075 [Paracidovorax avenae]|nr:hypothetical protein C8241_11075 [Paracidovorax avenae]